ncbi:MAG: hypothetical protein ACKO2K_02445 [Alphaproteobacteria bacterium]
MTAWTKAVRLAAFLLAVATLAGAPLASAGPPPVRNPAGMRNPAGPSPRNPAGPPPTDPTGSFSHLRPIRPPGTPPPSRPGGGQPGGWNHGHHGGWNGGGWGYPGYNPGVVVIGPTSSGGFPYGSNFYCQVHGIGFAFQDMFLEHVAYVDGVAPDYAMTLMYNTGGVWVYPGAW